MEEKKMNTGCLTTRNGYFYAVIKYKDKFGNWKQKNRTRLVRFFYLKHTNL